MKGKLVRQMHDDHGCFSVQASKDVDRLFASLRTALERHRRISIPGFGAFTLKHVRERDVRNPRTGAVSRKPAHDVIKFKEAKR